VRGKLQAEAGREGGAAVDAAMARAAAGGELGHGIALADLERAASALAAQAKGGELDEERIAGWIREGRVEEALAGLAHLAQIPLVMVAKGYHASEYDSLLFIVRSLGFGWIVFKLLLTKKAGRQPPYDVMRSAFDSFQQLSVSTAQRVVRFTAARDFPARAAA
jgi:hypothetical protein